MNFEYQAAIAPRARQVRRARPGLQGQEAGALVHPLPHGARRSRGRMRRPLVAVDLRRVPARAGERATSSARRVPELAGRDVSVLIWTTTPVDDPVEPGGRVPPGVRLRAPTHDGRPRVIMAEELAATRRQRDRRRTLGEPRRAHRRASDSNASRFRHPLYDRDLAWRARPTTSRSSRAPAPCTRRPATARTTSSPGMKLRPRDLRAGRTRTATSSTPWSCSRGQRVFDANPQGRRSAAASAGGCWHRETVPAPVPALLALPQPGDLPGHVAVVRPAWTASR